MCIVNQAIGVPGLFVPYGGREIEACEEDLAKSPDGQAVVRRALKRLYDMDLSLVEIGGVVGSRGATKLHITLWDECGAVIGDVYVSSGYPGSASVRVRSGQRMREAIRRDLAGDFKRAWMTAIGNEPDFPCVCDVQIGRDGEIELSVEPVA